MHVNCSITHTLNESATDEELNFLLKLTGSQLLAPSQRKTIEAFVSRKSIENFLGREEEGEQKLSD
ncbi:hypothetical protein [Vibrio sp. ER1A]|uniref:hypothetical protein n=1 Tax=Vibrio sp. ER1A TaxID=1517681 RepID=UPI0004DD62E5|nr:hypothetical protein [Vibrio sp. ER1A]KFA94912.1 hypothetical protein HW45_28770 [Vibrio sp. ER1A]